MPGGGLFIWRKGGEARGCKTLFLIPWSNEAEAERQHVPVWMEGGVIAIKQIFSTAHSQRQPLRPECNSSFAALGPHTRAFFIHKHTYVNTSLACTHAHHSCRLDSPLSLRVLPDFRAGGFFHTILFQLKRPKPSIYYGLSASTSRPRRCIFFTPSIAMFQLKSPKPSSII